MPDYPTLLYYTFVIHNYYAKLRPFQKKIKKKYLLKQIKAPPGQKAESLKKSCCLTTFIPNQ